jgi:predicted regulator of Ras-like GTPase activity (Roadblock/LC7/MglB family)
MANESGKSIKSNDATFLKGSLSLTGVTDLIQFLSSSYKSGLLQLTRQPDNTKGEIYFIGGDVIHVTSGNSAGMEGFAEILAWSNGTFQFHPDAVPPEKNMGLSVQHAIMEAAVLLDERIAKERQNESDVGKFNVIKANEERSNEMSKSERDSTEVMNDLLGIPGIDAVVVIGRDGFVIESAGSSTRVNIDELGASLAHAVNGIEEMGGELKVDKFQDMFIEYGRAVILCKPVGDAVAAVIAPDASKLGIIRHKTKKHFEELAQSF